MTLLENALNNPSRKKHAFNVLFADINKAPRREWTKWQSQAQTEDNIRELFSTWELEEATCWGFITGYNGLEALDFDWSWVYRLWKKRFGERAESLTQQTPNGGLRTYYLCQKPETNDRFKPSLHIELKGPGRFVVYEGKAKREDNSIGEYKVVNDKPVREDNFIIADTIAFLENILRRYSFLRWNCMRSHFSRKVLGEPSHDLRLFVSDIMACKGFSLEEMHNLFRDFSDYNYQETDSQLKYTFDRVKAGLKPPTCETLRNKLGWNPPQCAGCERKISSTPSGKEKKPKVRIIERPFGLPDPLTGTPFYEQALVDGELCFIIVTDEGEMKFCNEMETAGQNGIKKIIHPRLDLPYLNYVVKREWLETPDSMLKESFWNMGKQLLTTYVDFLEPWHASISMAAVALSYFIHNFRSVSYLYALGDTDSGKSRWAKIMAALSYRAYYGESPPTADIFEFITNCGCTIVEDEAQGMERDREKLKLYKVGYQQGSKTMRILINRNTGERRQVFFDAYGGKFFAGEEEVKNKGFMDRCIVMPFVKGHPQKDEFDPADDTAFQEVRAKLLALRILLEARKFIVNPYTCNEPWFEGRFKELYKPLLSVMPDSERQLILQAARERYETKRSELTESVEAKCVLAYLEAVKVNNNEPKISTEIIYEYLKPLIENIPEQYKPRLRSIGMKLTKLGFKTERLARTDGKRPRTRFTDAITITKLIRKYDLAEYLKDKNLSFPVHQQLERIAETSLERREVGQVSPVGPTLPSPSIDVVMNGSLHENIIDNNVGARAPRGCARPAP
jgi:hypothetical protein